MSKSKARSLRRKRAQKRKKAAMKRGVDVVHVVHEERPKSQDKDHNVAPSYRGNEGAPSYRGNEGAKKKRKHRRKKNKPKVTEEGKIDDAKNKPKVHEEMKIDVIKNKQRLSEEGKTDVKNKMKAAKEGKRDVVKNKQKVPKEGKINVVKNKQKVPEEGKIDAVNNDNTAPTNSAARPKSVPDVKAKVEISKSENTNEIENVNPVKVDDLPVQEETVPQVVEESVTKPVSPSELEPPIETQVPARKANNTQAIVYDDDNETNNGKKEDCACACVIM